MLQFKDKNGHTVNFSTIESEIDFTREQYEEKRELSKKELVDFDDFLENIVEITEGNKGTLEDAIFIANDAFAKEFQ
jgi:hypothetical protein